MSDTCNFYSLLMQALPFLCILSLINKAPTRGFLWCIVAGTIIYQIFSFTLPLSLGHLGMLTPENYRGGMLGFAAILLIVGLYRSPAILPAIRNIKYSPRWIDILIAIACALAVSNFYIEYTCSLTNGPVFFDSVNYHIPRALMWSWHSNLEPFRTTIWQQVGHPYGGTASLLPPIFYGCGWLYGAWNTEVFTIGAAVSIMLIAVRLGLSGRCALLAALAFMSFAAVGLRLSDVSTDIAGTFPVIAAVALFLSRASLAEGVFCFATLVCLGASCKQYAAFTAVPMALVLFIPHFKQIATNIRVLAAGLLGVTLGLSFFTLSFLPVYNQFGDISGGEQGLSLSTLGGGYRGVFETLKHSLFTWLVEPLSVLPEEMRGAVQRYLYIPELFKFLNVGLPPNGQGLDQERVSAGFLPLLLLPWLILGVKKRQRLFALALFIMICVAQFSPLAINHVGARFAIIPLAAFALLWGARANSAPYLVSLLIITALGMDLRYLLGRRGCGDRYVANYEDNRDISPIIKGDTLLLLGRSLTTDAFIAGRLGQVRFEYVNCPLDGDWIKMLTEYKTSYRWFMFSLNEPRTLPGPSYPSRLGPPCTPISLDQLRQWLSTAGWKLRMGTLSNHELWTVQQ